MFFLGAQRGRIYPYVSELGMLFGIVLSAIMVAVFIVQLRESGIGESYQYLAAAVIAALYAVIQFGQARPGFELQRRYGSVYLLDVKAGRPGERVELVLRFKRAPPAGTELMGGLAWYEPNRNSEDPPRTIELPEFFRGVCDDSMPGKNLWRGTTSFPTTFRDRRTLLILKVFPSGGSSGVGWTFELPRA